MTAAEEKAKPPRVLVADADPMVRRKAESVLSGAGFEVLAVTDGESALAEFDRCKPDILFLGLRLPGKDAIACGTALRAKESGRLVPLIISVADGDIDCLEQAHKLQFVDFVSRPIQWALMPYKIRRMLHGAQMRDQLRGSESKVLTLLQAIPDIIFVLNEGNLVLDQMGRTLSSVDGRPIDLVGQTLESALPPDVAKQARESIQRLRETGEVQVYEYSLGGKSAFETRLVAQPDHTIIAIVRDITDRRTAEAKIRNLAFYDQLTGLPNRERFKNTLAGAMGDTSENNCLLAILWINLDRFKRINETFGHRLGDAILKLVAKRLQTCIGFQADGLDAQAGDRRELLARLGGDEFALLVTDIKDENTLPPLASRIRAALSTPYLYDRHRFVITSSIGIVLYPRDAQSVNTLLTGADAAMHRAKAIGRNGYCFYSDSMLVHSMERLDLEHDLRRAIKDNELQLVYQPKVDLASWSVVGVEALLRWPHPDRGWIPPNDFIPVAEETGLIIALGEWVLAKACEQWRAWHAKGIDINISINVSSQQLQFSDFADVVLQMLRKTGVPPRCLELEITESLLMRNVDEVMVVLRTVHEAGVRLAVDDFGTGYSSLSYLKNFPLQALKIDRSFVRDLHVNKDDAAICAAILAMAKALGLEVIAEGVETEEQLDFLRRHGCDQIQGFLFSRPLQAKDLEILLLELGQRAIAESPFRSGTND